MAVRCEMCGREFKTTQGLRGHKTFVHQMTSSGKPPPRLATDQQSSKLEERVEQLTSKLQLLDKRLSNLNIGVDKLADRYEKLSRYIQYELAGIENDVMWEIRLLGPALKIRSHKPK